MYENYIKDQFDTGNAAFDVHNVYDKYKELPQDIEKLFGFYSDFILLSIIAVNATHSQNRA